jgi:drug/metabolite transporter (DMT)-like permease
MPAPVSTTATLIGAGAILIWSFLALLTAASGPVPPLQLVAITFVVGSLVGLAVAAVRGTLRSMMPTPASFALGLYGLLGDTTLYFAAIQLAPPAEANLIHYLWPLLIVLFAALLPGGRLRGAHVAGALIGLVATVLLVGGRIGDGAGGPAPLAGYACAFAGAFVWASYSVLSRRVAGVATESVAVTLAVAAVIAAGLHLAFEQTAWPTSAAQWAAAIGLGIGPIGAGFFLWDVGMKKGDVSLLGVASYATPALSTIALVVAGYATATWNLAAACLLIVIGAVVASWKRPGRTFPASQRVQ